jgi:hypothetical protein
MSGDMEFVVVSERGWPCREANTQNLGRSDTYMTHNLVMQTRSYIALVFPDKGAIP